MARSAAPLCQALDTTHGVRARAAMSSVRVGPSSAYLDMAPRMCCSPGNNRVQLDLDFPGALA
jgi:hypothetical protein